MQEFPVLNWHAELARALRQKSSPARYVDPIRQTRHVVLCCATGDFQPGEFEALARFELAAVDVEWQMRCDHQQVLHNLAKPGRSDQLHRLSPSGVAQCQQQPRQAGDVVAVHVADQDQADILEPPAEAAQADLSALATVKQNQSTLVAHQHAAQPAIRQRHHPARANQCDVEHHPAIMAPAASDTISLDQADRLPIRP